MVAERIDGRSIFGSEADVAMSPVVRRRRLAVELRRLRAASGKTLDEVAGYLECSPAKISRLETGQVGARIQDVRDLLECYGVPSRDRDALLDLVRQSRQRAWWHHYADMLAEDFLTYIGLEDEASTISTYETHLIPGLLQTPAYAQALMVNRRDTSLDQIDRGLQLRIARQQILDRDEPPRLCAVIDESVLRRPVGEPELQADQYRQLAAMAARTNITIQILPLSAEAHPDLSFPFTVLSFADPADPQIAYSETLTTRHYLDRAEDVGRYLAAFEHLRADALSPAESLAAIRAAAGSAS